MKSAIESSLRFVWNHPMLFTTDPPGGQRHYAIARINKETYLGWNQRKTNPNLMHYKPNGSMVACYHAETHVLSRIPKQYAARAKIYVLRVDSKGKLRMSKPCKHCMQKLLAAGIKPRNICYTNEDGNWRRLSDDL